MKTEMIEVLKAGEVRRMVGELAQKETTQNETALKIGVSQQLVNKALREYGNPGHKILDYFGLEMRRVIVRKTCRKRR